MVICFLERVLQQENLTKMTHEETSAIWSCLGLSSQLKAGQDARPAVGTGQPGQHFLHEHEDCPACPHQLAESFQVSPAK